MSANRNTENKLRSILRNNGYRLIKSRVKNISIDNLGGYMIINCQNNSLFRGSCYELDINDVRDIVDELIG